MRKALIIMLMGIFAGGLLSCNKGPGSGTLPQSGSAVKGEQGYAYKISVEKIDFSWMIEGSNLRVRLRAQTPGWVGVGFNPSEGMKDANFIMGFVKDGAATITNQHGISLTLHKKNEELGGTGHVMNPAGSGTDSETEISFTIPLKTGDKLDRPIEPKGDTVVLLAYGPARQLAMIHSFRAKLRVNLSGGAYTILAMTGK
jgi:hypothetical protein